MPRDLAVVFDVAGTLLKMFRVAKDIQKGLLIEKIVTSDLIMEKDGRALVVSQIVPSEVVSYQPNLPISLVLSKTDIEISCSSTPFASEEAAEILHSSKAKISNLQEAYLLVEAKCPSAYQTMGIIVDADIMDISYAICTAGRPFPGLLQVIQELILMQVDVYAASGDSRRSLLCLKNYGFLQDRIYSAATPLRKRDIVVSLKEQYKVVIMIGDGLNDLQALGEADLGVLTVQQDSHPRPCLFQAADRVIKDIEELPPLLREKYY